jgi:hypothetical protein
VEWLRQITLTDCYEYGNEYLDYINGWETVSFWIKNAPRNSFIGEMLVRNSMHRVQGGRTIIFGVQEMSEARITLGYIYM